jgi:hypothetical protein
LADIAEPFKDMLSHEKVNVIVTTQERSYSKVSIVNLDCFAAMMSLAAEDALRANKQYFSAYL